MHMRSCLSAFLFTLLLIGAVVGVGVLAMGQVRVGVCAAQPLRVGLSLGGGALLLAAILVALISLVNFELFEKGLSSAQVAIMAASLTVVGFGVASYYTLHSARTRCPRLDLASELQSVCQGQGLAQQALFVGSGAAADIANGDGFKVLSVAVPGAARANFSVDRLVVLDSAGKSIPWGEQASQEWKPAKIEDVGLVVCVGEVVQERLETCRYGGGISINRYQESVPLRLVDGQSGEILASTVLTTEPPACQPLGLQDLGRLRAKVSYDEMKAWVVAALADEPAAAAESALPTVSTSRPTPWPTATLVPSPTPTPEYTGVVKTGSRLRAGPSTDEKTVGGLVKGDTVLILGANPSRTWLYVQTAKGETAWIFSELVKPSAPLDQLPPAP